MTKNLTTLTIFLLVQLHRRIAISLQFADRVRVRVKYDRVSQRPHDVGPVLVLFTMLLLEEEAVALACSQKQASRHCC